MSSTIDKIYISNERDEPGSTSDEEEETDVIVILKNGEKFHASFFPFGSLSELRRRNLKSGEFLNGTYFWSKRMVLVSDCSRETIEKVVLNLWEEGELGEVFQRL